MVVAGPYRSGKSMLLNLLLPPSSSSVRRAGFAVGSSVQAVTKGIWLWGEPIHLTDSNKTVLFLDSEGLGAVGKQQSFDVQIFSLSVLLASLFLLNSFTNINEQALEQLELVVQMTQRVRVKEQQPGPAAKRGAQQPASSSSSSSASQPEDLSLLAAHFPDFLWVLRDFSLELQDASGSPITARQYLEQALQPVSGPRSADQNRVRHVLSTVFPRRDLVPLVRPVADEKQLQRMDRVPEKELRPEFVRQISALRQRVYEQVREKRVEGQAVNGASFLALAELYVAAINAGTIPVIHSAWASVVELQARQGQEEAMQLFQQLLKQATATLLTRQELAQAAAKAKAEALQVLSGYAVGEAAQVERLRQSVEAKMEEVVAQAMELNESRSREHNAQAFREAWKRVRGEQQLGSAEDERQWTQLEDALRAEYDKSARGEGREEMWRQLLSERKDQLVQRLMQRRTEERKQADRLKTEKEAAEKRAAEAERQTAQLTSELWQEKEKLKQEVSRAEAERQRSEERIRALEAQLKEAEREAKRVGKDSQAELEEARGRHRKAEAELRRVQEQLEREQKERSSEKASITRDQSRAQKQQQEEITRLEAAVAASRRQVEDEKKASSREQEELRQRLQRAEADRSRLEDELKEARGKERGLAAAQARLREKEEAMVELQRELAQARKDRDFYVSSSQREAEAAEEAKEEKRRLERRKAELETEMARRQKQGEEEEALNNQQMEDRLKRLAAVEKENDALKAELQRERSNAAHIHSELQQLQQQQPVLGKRRRKEEEDKSRDADMDMQPAADGYDAPAELDNHHAAAAAPRASSSSAAAGRASHAPAAGRRSLAPTRASVSGLSEGEPVDPHSLTVQQLKSWLTELEVELPMKQEKRQFYIDRLFQALPELLDFFHNKPTAASAGGKKSTGR